MRLISIEIESTYSGLIEGTRETASDRLRRDLQDRFDKGQGSGKALLLPDGSILPPWRCIAFLEGAPTDDSYDVSRLELCWFVDNLDQPVTAIVKECIERIDWSTYAKNGDWF